MARILVACLVSGWAAPARAEHAPPPAIVLAPAPPPELPAPEAMRRAFEVAPELRLSLPSCSAGSATEERCDGMGVGPGFGATLLWRPTPYFAFGGAFDLEAFRFQSAAAPDERASGSFVGLVGRVYFFEQGRFEPSVELGLGEGSLGTRTNDAGLTSTERAAGLAMRVGGGLELYLGQRVRLGPALAWTHLLAPGLRRCAGSQCVAQNPSENGHGSGFSSVSLRLTLLLGPSS